MENKNSFERKIMKEVMVIICLVIIGIFILWYFVESNLNEGNTIEDEVIDMENLNMMNNNTDNQYVALTTDDNSQASSIKKESIDSQQNKYSSAVININDIEQVKTTIKPSAHNSYTVDCAEVKLYYGNITVEKQEDIYTFSTLYDGQYRVDLSNMQNGTNVELFIYDEQGNTICSDTYCTSGQGVTAKKLQAGKKYTIKVKQDKGYTNYTLSIGMQKATTDITGYTEITDSIEYTDQSNIYTFIAPLDGWYRIDLSGIYSGTVVELYVFNHNGDTIASDKYCINGEGVTVKNCKAGEAYQIQVRQDTDFSSYTMTIGYQKDTVDISDYNVVNDSVEFTDQRNVYSFLVPVDGCYRFELSGMTNGTDVELYIFNALGETVASDKYCINHEGVTVKNLTAGAVYEIQIWQDAGFSDYILTVGKQKNQIDIRDKTVINDSVEYIDQINVYSLNRYTDEKITITISGLTEGVNVEIYVFNDLRETVTSDKYFTNGESISIKEGSVGTQYEIQIRQDSGISKYSLSID